MITGVHQKGRSVPSPSHAAVTLAAQPVSATDRPLCCSRLARVRVVLTLVVLCAITALFIQQTVYMKGWRPALPLGLEDQDLTDREQYAHLGIAFSDSESQYTDSDAKQNVVPSSFKDATLFKEKNTDKRHPFRKKTFSNIPGKMRSKEVKKSNFSSPLTVTEEDWPLKQHLVPIPLKSALGQASSVETSATRPITMAYIRNCKNDNPRCVEDRRLNFRKKCPYPGLVQTEDWDSADIVVLSVWRVRNERYVPDIQRPPGQIWVMLSVEAPSRKANHIQLDYQGLKGQFNLTMSYRLDADIPYPYGHLQRETAQEYRDFDAVYAAKRFHVAWLVSHCQTSSRREKYVRLLQAAGLEVHIYGSCGNYSCRGGRRSTRTGPNLPDSVCMPHLSKNYFFYLSFENTLCKDYITEKVFKIFDAVDLIPVVMGGADYSKFLPPGTYINVADYASAGDLAKYLKKLANDKPRYLSMLRKKHQWRRVARQPWYCTLGEKLATGLRPRVLPDTRAWYVRDQCWLPGNIG